VDVRPTGAAEAPDADISPEPEVPDSATTGSTTAPAPGEVDLGPVAALWPGDSADGFRERWREIQLRFVDEPQAAAEQADDLVEEAVTALTTSLQRVRAELGQWRSTRAEDNGETEHLRVAVQRYREFLESVVTL